MNIFFHVQHVQIIEEIKAYARCREHIKEAQYLKLLAQESLLYSKWSYKQVIQFTIQSIIIKFSQNAIPYYIANPGIYRSSGLISVAYFEGYIDFQQQLQVEITESITINTK